MEETENEPDENEPDVTDMRGIPDFASYGTDVIGVTLPTGENMDLPGVQAAAVWKAYYQVRARIGSRWEGIMVFDVDEWVRVQSVYAPLWENVVLAVARDGTIHDCSGQYAPHAGEKDLYETGLGNWIKCSDEMPEHGERVLIFVPGAVLTIDSYTWTEDRIEIAIWSAEEPIGWECTLSSIGDDGLLTPSAVSHWQPIPAGPEA